MMEPNFARAYTVLVYFSWKLDEGVTFPEKYIESVLACASMSCETSDLAIGAMIFFALAVRPRLPFAGSQGAKPMSTGSADSTIVQVDPPTAVAIPLVGVWSEYVL